MDDFMANFDVWINGVRADQTATRKQMSIEAASPNGKWRYHPILNWDNKMIYEYAKHYQLPKHPLEEKGYLSIGCEPCTRKFELDSDRSARWFGQKKTECGLHTELIVKN
jgi:phosphoadenosine phosphosulfate reductase